MDCVPYCLPVCKKDVDKLERIQRRPTEITNCSEDKSYGDSLTELGIFSLKNIKGVENMLTFFKHLKGTWTREWGNVFTVSLEILDL